MSATPRTLTLATLLAISGSLLAAPGCIIVADDDATLTIENESDFYLDEIRLADIGSPSWGPNLAPSGGLAPGDALELTDIDCDFYDLRVTDEEGFGCDMPEIDLCLNDALFIYENNSCDVLGGIVERRTADTSREPKAKQATPKALDATVSPK